MQIVAAKGDVRSLDTQGRVAFQLAAHGTYVLCDCEARAGTEQGALEPVAALDERLPRYAGQPLTNERIVLPFIGGLGDCVVLGSCLHGLLQRYPDCHVDVAAPPVLHQILQLLDLPIGVLDHPLPAERVKTYTYYMSLETPERFGDPNETSNVEIFSRCLGVPVPAEPVRLRAGTEPAICGTFAGGDSLAGGGSPRVGIAMTRGSHMRSYPVIQNLELARALLENEQDVVLVGVGAEIDHPLPAAPPHLINAVDATADMAELVGLIGRLDALVCPDSLFMHLAGALRVPTVAVFTSSSIHVAGGYPTVRVLTADVDCRPCGAAADQCPLKHPQCIVPLNPDLSAARVAAAAMECAAATKTAQIGQPGALRLE